MSPEANKVGAAGPTVSPVTQSSPPRRVRAAGTRADRGDEMRPVSSLTSESSMPRALYLLALAVFAMGTSEFMLAGLVPDIATDLGVSVGTAGLLTSAFAAGMVIGAPLMAAFARRWPARASLLAFVIAFAVAHIASAVTSSFVVLLVARVIAALANAGFLAVALRTATAMVATDRRGRALAVLLSGTTLATVLGVPGGALLGTVFGWRATFWAIALLCAPAAFGIAVSVRDRSGRPMASHRR